VTKKYLIIIERADDGSFSAYAPDLPGCVAVGQDTPEEAERLMAEAIDDHVELLVERGEPVPEPTSRAGYVEAHVA